MPAAPSELVLVGEVAKVHGIRGELSVQWHADSPDLLDDLDTVYLRLPGRPARAFGVAGWRPHQERVLLTLKGLPDRTAAEAWRGAEILVQAQDLPPLAEDELYIHQLEGLRVLLADGTPLGTIAGFVLEPQELWSIRTPEGREVLFPVQPQFVQHIDLDARQVVIDPPPGLLDIYLSE